jgi:hypothetical protein
MRLAAIFTLGALVTVVPAARAVVVPGGGGKSSDCIAVFDSPQANNPAPPHQPKNVDCVDGDPTCDGDGARNARCSFDVRLCVNSTAVTGCAPVRADEVLVDHALDNGDPRFDTDFQALQDRANLLGFPDVESHDKCSLTSGVTIALKPPRSAGGAWGKGQKTVRVHATGFATGRTALDSDVMHFTCRPEGNHRYGPRDLYTSTFDRIAQQVFAQSCALSGCHDSNSHRANMILLPGTAYSQVVGATPTNGAAVAAGWLRIMPGDPTQSFLYRKITCDLPAGFGSCMPLVGQPVSPGLIDIIRLWILGDATLGPAPADGWVDGTDQ